MTTYQLQAQHMIRKHGIPEALKAARSFAKLNDPKSREFWKYVVACIEHIAVQSAAMHDEGWRDGKDH